jgi:hypothetical protein
VFRPYSKKEGFELQWYCCHFSCLVDLPDVLETVLFSVCAKAMNKKVILFDIAKIIGRLNIMTNTIGRLMREVLAFMVDIAH